MGEMRTITVAVPAELLADAQAETGRDIGETIAAGLKRLASHGAQRRLLALRGSVEFGLDPDDLRFDRE